MCILGSLMDRSMTTLFATHAEPFCHSVAEEQDEIRWQNFVEGKDHTILWEFATKSLSRATLKENGG
jgi:hypothetical protein